MQRKQVVSNKTLVHHWKQLNNNIDFSNKEKRFAVTSLCLPSFPYLEKANFPWTILEGWLGENASFVVCFKRKKMFRCTANSQLFNWAC